MSNLDPIPDHAIVAQALRHGELQKALLDHFDEGVYMVDRERRILYWNAGAERITGYLAHEVAGHFCHGNLMMHCDAGGSVLCGKACPLSATMLDGRPRECTVFLRHKHGYRLPVYVRARPIYDSVGMLVGAVEVFEEWRPRAARNCTHYVVKYDLTGEVAKTPSPEHPAPAAKHDPAPQKSGHS